MDIKNQNNFIQIVRAFLLVSVIFITQNSMAQDNLLDAAFQGKAEIVRSLLIAGQDVNMRDKDGNTPLILAAIKDHEQVVRVLTSFQADLELKDNLWGKTALEHAAARSYASIVRILAEAGATFNLDPEFVLNLDPEFSTAIPIRLRPDSSVPSEHIDVFHKAADEWQQALNVTLFYILTPELEYNDSLDSSNSTNKNTIYWINENPEFFIEDKASKVDMYNHNIFINGDYFTKSYFQEQLSYSNNLDTLISQHLKNVIKHK